MSERIEGKVSDSGYQGKKEEQIREEGSQGGYLWVERGRGRR